MSHDNESWTLSLVKISFEDAFPGTVGFDFDIDIDTAINNGLNDKKLLPAKRVTTGNSSSRATGSRRNPSASAITTASLSLTPRVALRGGFKYLSPVCKTSIRAPLATIAALLLDTRTYPKWDTFCHQCTVSVQPRSVSMLPRILKNELAIDAIANLPTTLRDGTSFVIKYAANLPRDFGLDPLRSHYFSKLRTTCTLQVTHIEQIVRDDGRVGVRIGWCSYGRGTSSLMGSERFHELIPSIDDVGCVDLTCWQTYSGPLAARAVPSMRPNLSNSFATWMDDLRNYAERLDITTSAIKEVQESGGVWKSYENRDWRRP
jgi:hypothetical protein